MEFKRKFSCNLYKDLKFKISEMRFTGNWLTSDRGELYPKLSSAGDYRETCENGSYFLSSETGDGAISRLIGGFFPYSTYEISVGELSQGACFGLRIGWGKDMFLLAAEYSSGTCELYSEQNGGRIAHIGFAFCAGDSLLFTCHHGRYFDVYRRCKAGLVKIAALQFDGLAEWIREDVFSDAAAALYLRARKGRIGVSGVSHYVDCGIAQADIKPIRYEDGTPMVENGKLYLTLTSRYEAEQVQLVVSYSISGCSFSLEGMLLFDCGDGQWCGDVASSLIYDRNAKLWRIWMCAFSHGHVLAYGETPNDIRFGIQVMDVSPLPMRNDGNWHAFGGRTGDEDPDFYYDAETRNWYLSICRMDPDCHAYRYLLFRSRYASNSFEYLAQTEGVETTGGSFVKLGNTRLFICGRSFSERSRYDCYAVPSLEKRGELSANYPDGGFRGWGSVLEVPCGSRKKRIWITFDRINASDYNWSYGNIYVYETPTLPLESN